MKRLRKNKASLMVSALVIFSFISVTVLLIYVYSSNTFKQARSQEENLHVYYLAFSGCEIAYQALQQEAEMLYSGKPDEKWEKLSKKFKSADPAFQNKHTTCISFDGTAEVAGYANKTRFKLAKSGKTGMPVSELLSELKDAVILLKVTRVPDVSPPVGEEQYPGFIRIESIAKRSKGSDDSSGVAKYLYIDPINRKKIYWK